MSGEAEDDPGVDDKQDDRGEDDGGEEGVEEPVGEGEPDEVFVPLEESEELGDIEEE